MKNMLKYIKIESSIYEELPKDVEPLFGLWVLFELKKCSKEYQIEIINDIKNGNYPKI
jgi:hypothetical protein